MLAERPEYLASISLETRNLPDVYTFYVDGGKIYSPVTNTPVEYSMSLTTNIDRDEYEAFLKIEKWASTHKEGLCFWVSPPHIERSLQGKIIISELGNNNLQNRAILFDTTEAEITAIATRISRVFGDSYEYKSSEEVRTLPIMCNQAWDKIEWSGVLGSIISENMQWEMVRSGQDVVEAGNTLNWIKSGGAAPLGSNPVSCPSGSPLGVFSRGAIEGKMVKNCGKCGVAINKIIFKGYRCGNCGGEYLGC